MAYAEPSVVSRDALYQQLGQIVSREVERTDVDPCGGRLGEGQFGEVFKGTYTDPTSGRAIQAAIKMCKPDAGNKEHVEFMREAAIMGQWDHPHIIGLIGYITQSSPPMIVLELADCALIDQLARHECRTSALMGWAHEISMAMCYLAKKGYIHRDLACRNVLLVSTSAKLADFGRSRILVTEDEIYQSTSGLVPIRWTAPEALGQGLYTTASDVWSFGVLLYELWTRGQQPYNPEWPNSEVYDKLKEGWRLPPPVHCVKKVYTTMLQCWHPKPSSRPAFTDVELILRMARHSKSTLADRYKEDEHEPLQSQYERKVDSQRPLPAPPVDDRPQQLVYDSTSTTEGGGDAAVIPSASEATAPTYAVPNKAGNRPNPIVTCDTDANYAAPSDSLSNVPCSPTSDCTDEEYVVVPDGRGIPVEADEASVVTGLEYNTLGKSEIDDVMGEAVDVIAAIEKDSPKHAAGSTKMAARTSRWIAEWDARKGSVSTQGSEFSGSPKSTRNRFFRGRGSKAR